MFIEKFGPAISTPDGCLLDLADATARVNPFHEPLVFTR
jgi:hypothetical protein